MITILHEWGNSSDILDENDQTLLNILKDLQSNSAENLPVNPPNRITSTTGVFDGIWTSKTNEHEENIDTGGKYHVVVRENGGLEGYFCSETIFNLNHRVLTDNEIAVLGKGLGFSPIPFYIKAAKLKIFMSLLDEWDANDTSRIMLWVKTLVRFLSSWVPPKSSVV